MSEGLKIALTALGAVVVFVFGQFVQRIFIEPIQEQRRLRGKIANAVTVYRNVWLFRHTARIPGILDPTRDPAADAKIEEASKALHGLAADLRASVIVIPCYDAVAACRQVLKRADVWEVADQLLVWGGFGKSEEEAHEVASSARKRIMQLLKLSFGESDGSEA
jgi:hypothetical protein